MHMRAVLAIINEGEALSAGAVAHGRAVGRNLKGVVLIRTGVCQAVVDQFLTGHMIVPCVTGMFSGWCIPA